MIRHYWREVSFAVILVLPLLTLLPLGFLWLQERNWLPWWAGGAALAGVAAFGLRLAIARAMRRGNRMRAEEIASPSLEWRAHERAAWELVERQAEAAEPLSAEAWPALRQRLEATVDAVAQHFRPDAAQARWRITVPEALLLGERIARDLRRVSLIYLPGAEHLQLAHLFQARDFYQRHGETAKKAFEIAWTAKRFASLAANPAAALFNELKDLLAGEVSGHLTRRLRCDFAQILVRETGRAAIDLYAGRLRLDPVALRALADSQPRAPADLAAPIRLLLAGQAGAGKSSLLNALAGKALRQVKGTLIRDGPARVQVRRDGKPEVTITDLPGFDYDRRDEKALNRHIDDADMLVWVVSATEPSRAPDVAALKRLRARFQARPERRFPPLLVAVTHIDQMPPQREWAPPYDLLAADRPKAQAIRAALDHIGDTLAVERGQIVPVMARSLEQAYNIDLLWELIADNVNAARFTHLDRLHRKAGEFSLSRAAAQASRASAFLARRLLGR